MVLAAGKWYEIASIPFTAVIESVDNNDGRWQSQLALGSYGRRGYMVMITWCLCGGTKHPRGIQSTVSWQTSVEEWKPRAKVSARTTSSMHTAANMAAVSGSITTNRRITFNERLEETGIARETLLAIIHDGLERTKVCLQWVPHAYAPQQDATTVHFTAPSG